MNRYYKANDAQWAGERDGQQVIFDTEAQAQWFVLAGENLSAAEAARRIENMDKCLAPITAVQTGLRSLLTLQKTIIMPAIDELVLGEFISIGANETTGEVEITLNLSVEQIAQTGRTSAEIIAGLEATYRMLTGISAEDSRDIYRLMK